MKKFFAIAAALAGFSFAASAQLTEVYKDDYTQFTNIEASKFVEVKLAYSSDYATRIVVDKLIADYVLVYAKGSTLYLSIDEKSYAPEVKKALKGKNAIVPQFMVTVYAPSLNSIRIENNVLLYSEDVIKSDNIKVVAEGNSVIKNLKFDSQDAAIKLSNKAQGRFDIYTNSISVDASNNAGASIALNCSSAAVGAAGSANVTISAEAKNVTVKAQGSASVTLTGTSDKVSVEGINTSRVYAAGCTAASGDVVLTNSSLCEINAKERLKVDLTGSSHLVFNANPAVEVTRILSSTMTRSSDAKQRR